MPIDPLRRPYDATELAANAPLARSIGAVDLAAQAPAYTAEPDAPLRPMTATELPGAFGDNEITKGLRRGLLGIFGTSQAAKAQLAEPFSARIANQMFGEANRTLDFGADLRPKVASWDDVRDIPSFLQYGAGKAAEAFPSSALSLGAAGLGTVANLGLRALTRGRVNLPLGFAAGAASMLPQEAGEQALSMHNDPAAMANTTPWERVGLSAAKGGINAALEFAPEAIALRRAFGAPRLGRGLLPALGTVGLGAAEAAGGEALTEGLQEKTGQIFQGFANPQRDTAHDWENIREAAIGGAFGGAGLGAVGGGVHALRSNLTPPMPSVPEALSGMDIRTPEGRMELGSRIGDAVTGLEEKAAEVKQRALDGLSRFLDETAHSTDKNVRASLQGAEKDRENKRQLMLAHPQHGAAFAALDEQGQNIVLASMDALESAKGNLGKRQKLAYGHLQDLLQARKEQEEVFGTTPQEGETPTVNMEDLQQNIPGYKDEAKRQLVESDRPDIMTASTAEERPVHSEAVKMSQVQSRYSDPTGPDTPQQYVTLHLSSKDLTVQQIAAELRRQGHAPPIPDPEKGYVEIKVSPYALSTEITKQEIKRHQEATDRGEDSVLQLPELRENQTGDSDSRRADIFVHSLGTLMAKGMDLNGVKVDVTVPKMERGDPANRGIGLPANLALGKNVAADSGLKQYTLNDYVGETKLWTPKSADKLRDERTMIKRYSQLADVPHPETGEHTPAYTVKLSEDRAQLEQKLAGRRPLKKGSKAADTARRALNALNDYAAERANVIDQLMKENKREAAKLREMASGVFKEIAKTSDKEERKAITARVKEMHQQATTIKNAPITAERIRERMENNNMRESARDVFKTIGDDLKDRIRTNPGGASVDLIEDFIKYVDSVESGKEGKLPGEEDIQIGENISENVKKVFAENNLKVLPPEILNHPAMADWKGRTPHGAFREKLEGMREEAREAAMSGTLPEGAVLEQMGAEGAAAATRPEVYGTGANIAPQRLGKKTAKPESVDTGGKDIQLYLPEDTAKGAEGVPEPIGTRYAKPVEHESLDKLKESRKTKIAFTDAFDNIHIVIPNMEADFEAGFPYIFAKSKKSASPTSVQKRMVAKELGLTKTKFSREINTIEKYKQFLIAHEQSHIDNNDRANYPRNEDGSFNILSRKAIEIEKRATQDGLKAVRETKEAAVAKDIKQIEDSRERDEDDAIDAAAERSRVMAAVKEFDDYVKRGYYSQWYKDSVAKVGKEATDEKSQDIRAYRVSQIPALEDTRIGTDGSSIANLSAEVKAKIRAGIDGTPHRVMVGNHGVYVEFTPADNAKNTFVKERLQYDEYKDAAGNKLYKQTKTVNYADYKVGKWYVALEDLLKAPAAKVTGSPSSPMTRVYYEPMTFPMPAKDNVTGEVTTTFRLILNGTRTATTRHWTRLPKVGETLRFYSSAGREHTVDVRVTKVSPPLGEIFEQEAKKGKSKNDVLAEMSKAEGWTPEAFQRHYKDGKTVDDKSIQVTFERVAKQGSEPVIKRSLQSEDFHRESGKPGFAATHDSPVRHEGKFDWRKHIGKGQGASSFGAGTYLSTAEGVHKSYKEEFTRDIQRLNDADHNSWFDKYLENPDAPLTMGLKNALIRRFTNSVSKMEAELQRLQSSENLWESGAEADMLDINLDHERSLLDYVQRAKLGEPIVGSRLKRTSPTYHVSVDIDPTHLLDWNKPLNQQSKFVQKALEKEGFSLVSTFEPEWEMDYAEPSLANEPGQGEENYIETWRAEGEEGVVGYVHESGDGKWHASEVVPKTAHDDYDNVTTHPRAYNTKEEAQKALKPFLQGGLTGEDIYNRITDKFRKGVSGRNAQAMTSDALQKAGILGHRYNAVGGRNDKFPNYVIYDDSKIHNTAVTFSMQEKKTPGWEQPRSTHNKLVEQLKAIAQKMFGGKVQVIIGAPNKKELQTNARGWYMGRRQLDEYKAVEAQIAQIRKERREALDNGDQALADSLLDSEAKLQKQQEVVGIIFIAPHLANAEMIPTFYHEAVHAAFDILLSPQERAILGTAFSRGLVRRQLEALFKNDPGVMAQLKDVEEAAAYGFQIFAAAPHLINLGPQTKTIFQKVKNWFRKMLGILTPEEKASVIMSEMLSGRRAETGLSPLVRLLDKDAPTKEKVKVHARELASVIKQFWDFLATPVYDRLIALNNPAMAEFAKLGHTKTGEKGDVGMVQRLQNEIVARLNWLNKFTKRYTEDEFNAAVEARLNSKVPTRGGKTLQAYNELQTFFDDFHKYMEEAEVVIGRRKSYWPMLWNAEAVMKNRDAFLKMLAKPEYKEHMEKLMVTPTELWENISGYVTRGESFQGVLAKSGEPVNAYSRERSLSFITAEDRKPFMSNDHLQTMHNYIANMVRQAEFVRAYGQGGQRATDLLGEAEHKYGATKADIALAKDYLDSLLGNREIGMSRELKDIYGAAIVYQNYRLLPFNLFTSLVDPLGIAVRSGKIGDALEAFTYSMKNMFRDMQKERPDAEKDYYQRLAEDWGYIEDAGTMSNLRHMAETTELHGFSKRMNDALFKWNFLNGWTRSTKIMAVKAAERFMLRSAEGKDDTAKRHLEELGLKKSDIISNGNGGIALRKEELMAKGLTEDQATETERRLRDAMTKFVNQAILNPTAADFPNWGSNPYMAPVFHLKQFMFTFQSTILSRIIKEAGEGNYKPLWIAGIYIPGMMGADLLRNMVSNLGDTPPWQKDWGATDYVLNGVSRSGLTGVGQMFLSMQDDVSHGGQGYESLIGPTAEQIKKGLRAAQKGDMTLWNFIVKSIPLNPIFDQWILAKQQPKV